MALLELRGLVKTFASPAGPLHALRGVDLTLEQGRALGLVGESGCGKTTLGRLALRLLEPSAGAVRFRGEDLARLSPRRLRHLRRRMQMVFQDPHASLNPQMTVYQTVAEPLQLHRLAKKEALPAKVSEALRRVGLDDALRQRLPHQLSVGQKQRVGIARALATSPDLLLADEPIAALDVSVQAQIVNLLADLRQQMALALLFISHDLAMVWHLCDEIAVMYLGQLVERATVEALGDKGGAWHPYTAMLARASRPSSGAELAPVGEPASALSPPSGCTFHPRCPLYAAHQNPRCREQMPDLVDRGGGHLIACHEESSALSAARGSLIDSLALDG